MPDSLTPLEPVRYPDATDDTGKLHLQGIAAEAYHYVTVFILELGDGEEAVPDAEHQVEVHAERVRPVDTGLETNPGAYGVELIVHSTVDREVVVERHSVVAHIPVRSRFKAPTGR